MDDIEDMDEDMSIYDLKKRKDKDDSDLDEEEERRKEGQRLKAVIHYHTAKMLETECHASKLNLSFDNQFVSALASITYNFAESFGNDLWYFAQHGKRHTVQPEDVRLCARKSDNLYTIITENMNSLATGAEERKNNRKSKKSDNQQDDNATKKKSGRPKKIKLNDDEDDLDNDTTTTTTTTTTSNSNSKDPKPPKKGNSKVNNNNNNNNSRVYINDDDDNDFSNKQSKPSKLKTKSANNPPTKSTKYVSDDYFVHSDEES